MSEAPAILTNRERTFAMAKRELPSPELLCKLLRYEPDTGKLFWLPRDREHFIRDRLHKSWNTRFSNKEALTSDNCGGYKHGAVLGKNYLAHRVIWAMQTGAWPKEQIDHADRDRYNNRWSNLREATHGQNCSNKTSLENSSSKYLGVSWKTDKKIWRARIWKDGQEKHLGHFGCEIKAAQAYDKAAKKIHGQFASLNFPDC